MAEKLGWALLDLDTDDTKFRRGVARAERHATGLGRTLDDTSRRAGRLGKALAIAAGGAGAAAFTAGIVGAVRRLEELRKASAQVDQALKNSGNTWRSSAKEIEAWADALEDRTGRAAEEVMDVAANLASFGFGRTESFRALTLADDMAAAWGGDLRQNLEGLARALDDPIGGMAMLSKRGIKLTEEQKEMAQAFLDAGDKIAAQGVVFEALEAQVKGVAEAGFGGLSKALAQAQKRWEDAFEDLVTGKGDAEDLRNTLVDLADTLSSPEFIGAVMGFGRVTIQVVDGIAQAIAGAWKALQDLTAWLNRAGGPVERVNKVFGPVGGLDSATARRDLADYEAMLAGDEPLFNRGWVEQRVADLRAELGRRDRRMDDAGAGAGDFAGMLGQFVTPGSSALNEPGFNPYEGLGTGASDAGKKVRELIADLQHERDIVGLSALDQEILNTIRRAGVGVMSDEGLQIRALITETAEHREQIEQMQEVYDLLGDIGKSAIMGLVDAMKDGKIEGTELLGILGNVLSMAGNFFLNQGMGSFGGPSGGGSGLFGALGSIFAGLFADGGLIPNGSFGIVGEAGPELVTATARGASVMSNADLGSAMAGTPAGPLQIVVQGAGLSQAEMTQAISDAIDRFDRYRLPGRVASITADPLARG